MVIRMGTVLTGLMCMNTEPPVGDAIWRGCEVCNWDSLAGGSRLLMGGPPGFQPTSCPALLPSPLIMNQPKPLLS